MSDDLKCPKCSSDLQCLGGSSAHPNNWYCTDEKGCGWQAWDKATHKLHLTECRECDTHNVKP